MPEYQVAFPGPSSRPDSLTSNRQVKLNFGALTSDDLIESPKYPPTAVSGLLFGSDLARSWTQGSADVESVQPNFLVQHLLNLPKLEKLQIQNAPWLTWQDVRGILWNCPRLRKVDFRQSGKLVRDQASVVSGNTANWGIPWAMKGSSRKCAATLPATLASKSLAGSARAWGSEQH